MTWGSTISSPEGRYYVTLPILSTFMAPDSSGSGCIGLQGHNGTEMFEAGGREAPQLEWRAHLVLTVSSFVWILNHAMCPNCVHTKPHLRWSGFSILHFVQSQSQWRMDHPVNICLACTCRNFTPCIITFPHLAPCSHFASCKIS